MISKESSSFHEYFRGEYIDFQICTPALIRYLSVVLGCEKSEVFRITYHQEGKLCIVYISFKIICFKKYGTRRLLRCLFRRLKYFHSKFITVTVRAYFSLS
jgi:hypothetical protein